MIWQCIVQKKSQRQLQLMELLQQERFTATGLARQIQVSPKTVLRDLAELQQQKFVVKADTWQINWEMGWTFSEAYRKRLLADPRFQLFEGFLWNHGPRTISYSQVRQLNQVLLRFNLSAHLQLGRLLGNPSIILHLQMCYLREFFSFEEEELYQYMDQHYQKEPAFLLKEGLIPDMKLPQGFRKRWALSENFSPPFFLDYTRYHYPSCFDLYLAHQQQQTELYQEVCRGILLVDEWLIWEPELMEEFFTVKLFDLFIGLHQGLPLWLFNSRWTPEQQAESFFDLSKLLKQQLPLLSNCRVDELSLALKNIFNYSRQITLSLQPNLTSSLVVQERSQPLFISQKSE